MKREIRAEQQVADVASHSMLVSTPLMRALPPLAISVTLFGPRNENWKFFQSSQKSAPFQRRVLSSHCVFQPTS